MKNLYQVLVFQYDWIWIFSSLRISTSTKNSSIFHVVSFCLQKSWWKSVITNLQQQICFVPNVMQYRFHMIDAECLTESKMLPDCDGNDSIVTAIKALWVQICGVKVLYCVLISIQPAAMPFVQYKNTTLCSVRKHVPFDHNPGRNNLKS